MGIMGQGVGSGDEVRIGSIECVYDIYIYIYRTSGKRLLPLGALAVTDRLISHILTKRVKLAEKLQAVVRPPE